MEPQIRYARTADGVSIAYYAMGSGPAVIDLGPPPVSHLRAELQIPEIRNWYERFASQRTFVRFDGRGTGLSEREIADYSTESLVRDLEAVVDALGLDRLTLMGQMNSGLAAITYAARHPDKVEALILWCAYTRGSEFFEDSGTLFLRDALSRDWGMFTESASNSRFGWLHGDFAHRFAGLWREAVAPEVQALLMDSLRSADVSGLLASVQAPTLVLQREERGTDVARRIAAGIRDARVAIFDGTSAAPYLPDAEQVWGEIAGFIGLEVEAEAAGRSPRSDATGGLRTVLFTDIVGHTEMMQRLGDAKGRDVLREHERITRDLLKQHGGAEVKTMGDGFMASFGSVTSAMECAIALQRAFHGQNQEPGTENLHVRVGLNAGEPIEEDGDLFGATVILASRIAAKAGAGEILIPEPVRHLLSGKSFAFADRGEFVPKGFDDAVRLYEVRWQE
jgi:class 3 adenylate cyclase